MLERYFFISQVASVVPSEVRTPDGSFDRVITKEMLRNALNGGAPEALVIRTMPPTADLDHKDWTGSNPCYLERAAGEWLREIGVRHLLIDLPSVDREEDGGVLAAHHAFWGYPGTVDLTRTITELIRVPDHIPDGRYVLEIQVAHFINDAAPSRPVLYALMR